MRVRSSLGCLAAVLPLVATAAAGAQELLDRPGPIERSANPITPENPIPARTLSVTPLYPPEAASIDAMGRISLIITINELGRVSEVRRPAAPPLILSVRTSDPALLRSAGEALTKASADAVRQWQYAPPAKPPVAFSIGILFKPGAEPELMPVSQAPAPRPEAARTPPATEPLPPEWGDVVRVGGDIRPPSKVGHVNPVYPAEARDARVQGVVIMTALVDAEGRVADVRVLRSIPMLDQAALDAVRQWQFTPTLLNGNPVPVAMTVTVSFTLR
jgi:protein TonB